MIPEVRIIRHRTLQHPVEPNLLAFLVLHIIRQCPTWATMVRITVYREGVYVTATQSPTSDPVPVYAWDN